MAAEKQGEKIMRQVLSIVAIVVSFVIISLVDSPAEDINNPGWDWTTTLYDSEPTNPKIVTVWWDVDQGYTPETIWCVRHTLDEFASERDFNLSKFEHLIPVVRKRLEENCGLTGFRVIGAGIEDAI